MGLPYFPAPEEGQDLLAYPNPAQDHVWLAGVQSMTATWTLYDAQGNACLHGEATPWFRVRLDGLKPGMYVISTREQDGTIRSAKIIKQP